jgi:hypothetical protein
LQSPRYRFGSLFQRSAETKARCPSRKVIDDEQLKEVKKCLREEFVEEPTNWSRRYKANNEKLDSGEVMKVAQVVRDLWRRDPRQGSFRREKSACLQKLARFLSLSGPWLAASAKKPQLPRSKKFSSTKKD